MGLREDAEAARLLAIENKAAQERLAEASRLQREQQKRAEQEELAQDVAREIGVGELEEMLWVTDPPISGGYVARTYLHVRSDDGVWLRFDTHKSTQYGPVEYRWAVVQKCPVDDHWFYFRWSTRLAEIGEQLTVASAQLAQHISDQHPEYI